MLRIINFIKVFTVVTAIFSFGIVQAGNEGNSLNAGSKNKLIPDGKSITYQGILKDSKGFSVKDGDYGLIFRIYESAENGKLLRTSAVTYVKTEKGYFSTMIDLDGLPVIDDYYLTIQVEGDVAEMLPRQRIQYFISDFYDSPPTILTADTWTVTDSVLYTNDFWGIARGDANNVCLGDNTHTMINLGVICTTGTSGQGYFYMTVGGGYKNTASHSFSVAAGGYSNKASGQSSAIGGGYSNKVSSDYGAIGGGYDNTVSGIYSFVGGGYIDTASGDYSSVGGGKFNIASNYFSAIAGGNTNSASGHTSTISGGYADTASGDYSFIGGGKANKTSNNYSTISGGNTNTASGLTSTIGGGNLNKVTSECGVIGGGSNNVVIGLDATISGGYKDTASGDYSSVGGGKQNIASNIYSTIAGGNTNTGSGHTSTISGGYSNEASSLCSVIGGGFDNAVSGIHSAIAGGRANNILAQYSAISGGYADTIASGADYSYLFGIGSKLTEDSTFMVDMPHIHFGDETDGYEFPASDGTNGQVLATDGSGQLSWGDGDAGNWSVTDSVLYTDSYWGIARGGASNNLYGDSINTMVNLGVLSTTGTNTWHRYYPTVGGGYKNSAAHNYSTVGGGYFNIVIGEYGTISGGDSNSVYFNYGTVAGGKHNYAGPSSFVGGGEKNRAESSSVVCGGSENTSSSLESSILGGKLNFTGGIRNAILGGYADSIVTNGDQPTVSYSMAFGRQVYIDTSYRVAFFNGTYSGCFGVNRDFKDSTNGVMYPIHVGTNNTNGNGAHLTPGGVWTNGSSRTFKENYEALNGSEILQKIAELPVERWDFKGTEERHIGPYAEDFVAAFDVGTMRESDGQREDKYLAAGDVAGVALAGVQALLSKIKQLEARIDKLEAERR